MRLPIHSSVRIPALDGLRAIAVLLVMVRHMTPHPDPTNPFLKSLWLTFHTGWIGVDLFFVLSGFLITGILIDTRERPNYFSSFIFRRAVRILPLYYLAAFVLMVVYPAFNETANQAIAEAAGRPFWVWTMLTNVARSLYDGGPATAPFVSHLWSVSIEEQFYLFWPLAVFFGRKHLAAMCVFLVAVSVVGRPLALFHGITPHTLYALTPYRMDGLGLGALMAILARQPRVFEAVKPYFRPAFLLSLLVVIATFVIQNSPESRLRPIQMVGYGAICFGAVALLGLALSSDEGSRLHQVLTWKGLRRIGELSYGLYIIHMPLTHVADQFFFSKPPDTQPGMQLLWLAGYFAVVGGGSYVLAWMSWNFWEKHWLRLKDRPVLELVLPK